MKHLIPVACVIFFFVGDYPAFLGCPIENRLLYIFSHANVLHLGINLFSYYSIVMYMKPKYIVPLVLFFGAVASLAAVHPTAGLSGALFGLFGVCAVRFRFRMKQYGMVFFTIAFSSLLPHISWSVHLLGFLSGNLIQYIYGRIYGRKRGTAV